MQRHYRHQSFIETTTPRTASKIKKKIGPYYYHLNDCIGSGYSSQVYRGYLQKDSQSVFAIKVIQLKDLDKANLELLENEIKVLKQFEHPNILGFNEVFFTINNCYIITEYCEGGTLQSHIETNPNLDWQDVFRQLLQGLNYLGQICVVHRDIKPANIFKKGDVWKIGDFGFARKLPNKNSQVQELYMVGSPLYMPPETLEKKIYSLKTDYFAFGILLFHLVTKQFPWSGQNRNELLYNYANSKYPSNKINHLPPHYQSFLKGLCEIEISRRMSVGDFNML